MPYVDKVIVKTKQNKKNNVGSDITSRGYEIEQIRVKKSQDTKVTIITIR